MSDTPQQQQPQQVQIKADEKEMLGQYSNLAMIHHSPEEFTFNYVYVFPNVAAAGAPQGKLVASVIVNPAHAKRLWRALGENIARYEAQFGTIRENPAPAVAPTVGLLQ
ncbi:MAG TPA: DUF3467 domain-containing protein [Candidatus Acidoferrales bacterium]|jgi:hypothetical protein|nr:DUF3467 domain-containing protein [Candidatus Acidoferrales bacterium]